MIIDDLAVGLIGGTGEEGRGLALRWALSGAKVTIGSRTIEKAKSTAEELNAIIGGNRIGYSTNQGAIARSVFALLTVPFAHAASTLEAHRKDFREDSILLDITVPVTFEQGKVRYVDLPEGSASEHLQALLPSYVALVAAFKTEPAHLLADLNEPLECDSFIASDSKEAKTRVMNAIKSIEGLRPVDAGTLYSARALERMTLLAIGINRRYKVKTARYRIIGL